MVPAIRERCQLDGCDYITPKYLATQDAVLRALEIHLRFHELSVKILEETLKKDLTFVEIVKLVQNVESARQSSGVILESGGASSKANKISETSTESPRKKCSHCGTKHRGIWRSGVKEGVLLGVEALVQ